MPEQFQRQQKTMHCCNAKNKRGNTDVVLLLTHGNLNVFSYLLHFAQLKSSGRRLVPLSHLCPSVGLSQGRGNILGTCPARCRLGYRASTTAVAAYSSYRRHWLKSRHTGQDFCLMFCQAKKLLQELEHFIGGKNTAVI